MNIKSNKENRKGFNLSLPKKWVEKSSYWYGFIIPLIVIGIATVTDGTWGLIIILTVIGVAWQTIYVGVNESSRRSDARYYSESDYGPDKQNWFAFIFLPLVLIGAGYWGGIKPMIYDYDNAERIDKVLTMDVNTTLYYNDANKVFVLFIEGQKQPLVIDRSGSSESYNRLKAGYLDNKIEVIKKETKSWADDKSKIAYTFDDYKFD